MCSHVALVYLPQFMKIFIAFVSQLSCQPGPTCNVGRRIHSATTMMNVTSHNLAAYRLVWTPDASGHVRKSLEGNLVSVLDLKPIPVWIAFRGLGTRLESNLAWRSVLLECQGFKSY